MRSKHKHRWLTSRQFDPSHNTYVVAIRLGVFCTILLMALFVPASVSLGGFGGGLIETEVRENELPAAARSFLGQKCNKISIKCKMQSFGGSGLPTLHIFRMEDNRCSREYCPTMVILEDIDKSSFVTRASNIYLTGREASSSAFLYYVVLYVEEGMIAIGIKPRGLEIEKLEK